MLDQLPEFIDPLHLADKRGELHGKIPLLGMARLAEITVDSEGSVVVDMVFGRDGRLAKIEGRIQACLQLKCQSCLNAIEWKVDNAINLGIVNSIDQANRLPEEYEPLLIGEGKIPLKDIIEDELLLSVPEYPKHEYDCFAFNSDVKQDELLKEPQALNENPFSILAKLKT
ncbi:MAG: YceD family protein [Methylococcales bacterium]